jgi:hypothetical protein
LSNVLCTLAEVAEVSEDDIERVTERMKKTELKALCKICGLSASGKKDELRQRLRECFMSTVQDDFEAMDDDDLRVVCNTRNIPELGSRSELLKHLRAEISYCTRLLQEKPPAEPKYVDVTISSIGMTPEKFTVGGAPSVTADVLRKLAGDPFDDPPRFGMVCSSFNRRMCNATFIVSESQR